MNNWQYVVMFSLFLFGRLAFASQEMMQEVSEYQENQDQAVFASGEVEEVKSSAFINGKSYSSLNEALVAAIEGDQIVLSPGRHLLTPSEYVDPLCGNCYQHQTEVKTSIGIKINKSLTIIGSTGTEETIIITNAGYGILVEGTSEAPLKVSLSNLSITGGVNSQDKNATDGGIVVRNAQVNIDNVVVFNNKTIKKNDFPGIGGIVGREGAQLFIKKSLIKDNSWDGIGLYRQAYAEISDSVITRGDSVGVGVTWDARAKITGNVISSYWKGISSFVTAQVEAHNNYLFNIYSWGVSVWGEDDHGGDFGSSLKMWNNILQNIGDCGIIIDINSTSEIKNNIIDNFGFYKKMQVCPKSPIVLIEQTDKPESQLVTSIEYNLFSGANYGPLTWVDKTFPVKSRPLSLSTTQVFMAKSLNTEVNNQFFNFSSSSVLYQSGAPESKNLDGSRSHLGFWGGQTPMKLETLMRFFGEIQE